MFKTTIMFGIITISSSIIAAERQPFKQDALLETNISSPKEIQLSQKNSLVLVKSINLSNGKIKAKFQQHFQHIPVWAYTLTADKTPNGYTHWYGNTLQNIPSDLITTTPAFNKEEAINKWFFLSGKIAHETIYNKQATLYVMMNKNRKARLVYLVSFVRSGKKPSRPMAFMDAITGDIITRWDGLTTKGAKGPGGNEKTGRYQYGTDFPRMEVTDDCIMSTDNVDTINLNHETSGGMIYQFESCGEDPENTFKEINGAYSPINDAHFFGNEVFDMYRDWYQTAPLSFKLRMRVHYYNRYENAFWDGQQMTFGDGANRFYPLVSLDVVAHEVSHGFTEQNSDLIYYAQSGGINESFSDISGEAAKFYNQYNNDWLVGETIFKAGGGTALRYFEEPEKDGRSIGHANKYYDGMDVHYSSGVFNRAFFLLSNTTNWNTKKAFDAFVLANQVYWRADATFDSAGCGVKKAATDLGYSEEDIARAFDSVGVNTKCGDDPTPHPKGFKIRNGQQIGTAGPEGSEIFFLIDIPLNVRYLRISTHGGTGDVDLYVRKGEFPTMTDYDCRPYKHGNDEGCDFLEPKPGTYYIMLKGYTAYFRAILQGNYYFAPIKNQDLFSKNQIITQKK